jgi:uncharacterized membrane protein YczE
VGCGTLLVIFLTGLIAKFQAASPLRSLTGLIAKYQAASPLRSQ